MHDFIEILKDLISETGLSLRQLAKESNVLFERYSKYLQGSSPTLPIIIKIAKYFNCSLDYLFGLSETKCNDKYLNYTYDMSGFVDRYKSLLKLNNISHYKFTKKFNLFDESILRHWQAGKTPRLDVIYNIAKTLGGSMDELVGRK